MTTKPITLPTGFRLYPAEGLAAGRLARLFFSILWRTALVCLLGGASGWLTSRYVIQIVQVEGVSMFPTLRNADSLFLQRWFYHLYRDPAPRDIVVIKDPSDQGYAIKRIVAGPGDIVFLSRGRIYVNGRRLAEPYLPPGTWTFPAGNPHMQWMIGCPENEYIVLGDNRKSSFDSRYYGAIARRNILGIVFH